MFSWFRNIFATQRELQGDAPDRLVALDRIDHRVVIKPVVLGKTYQKPVFTINFAQMIEYYLSVPILFSCVNKISLDTANFEVENLNFSFLDNKKLKSLVNELSNSLLVCGSAFLLVVGSPKKDPISIRYIDPKYIRFDKIQSDTFTVGSLSYTYDPFLDIWVSKDNLSYAIHLKNIENMTRLGISPLNTIATELDILIGSSSYNANVLTTGVSATGILSRDDGIGGVTQDNLDRELSKYVGVDNAGGIMVMNGRTQYHDLSVNTRDADFLNLVAKCEKNIYITYQMSPALFEASAMTNNNYASALIDFRDNVVLPNRNKILSLFERLFEVSNIKFEFVVLSNSINIAIQKSMFENMKIAKETGVFTVNEIREIGGLPSVEDGDVLANTDGMI